MLRLSTRLRSLLDAVEPCAVLADIGCDHGYLSAGAVLSGKAERVIAADISAFCVEKAKETAKKCGIEDKIQCVKSDGFSEIRENIDTAVIAGMGGRETVKILENAKLSIGTYILSPHQDVFFLREYLKNNGFFIEADFVVFDGKFYEIIKAKKTGINNYTRDEIFFGKNMPESEHFILRLRTRKTVLKAAVREAKDRVAAQIINELEAINNYDENL